MKKHIEAVKSHFKFYKKIFGSLNPFNYADYAEFPIRLSFSYFASVIFSAMVVMVLLFIPAVVSWPDVLSNEMEKFSNFKVSVNATTTEPLKFPNENPFLVINSKSNFSSDAPVVVDESKFYYKFIFNRYMIDFTGNSDIKANKEKYIPIILTLFLLMMPTILLVMYFWFLIKFLAIILAATVTLFVITRLVKYDISFKRITNIAFRASTLTVMASIIIIPFAISTYYLEFAPFLVYLVLGIVFAGKDSDKKRRKTGYIEVKA